VLSNSGLSAAIAQRYLNKTLFPAIRDWQLTLDSGGLTTSVFKDCFLLWYIIAYHFLLKLQLLSLFRVFCLVLLVFSYSNSYDFVYWKTGKIFHYMVCFSCVGIVPLLIFVYNGQALLHHSLIANKDQLPQL